MNLSKKFDKRWWKAVKWVIVLAAYGFMAYKLATYDNYAALWETIRTADTKLQVSGLILVALLLMPLNILLEAAKWRFLNRDIEKMSISEAQRQVYCGFIGAFLTPYRVGDFPTRALFLRNQSKWGQATLMGFVGSVALTLVIVVFGLIPAVFYFNEVPSWWQVTLAIIGCAAFGFIAPILIKKEATGDKQQPSFYLFLGAIAWSALRYLVFALQLYLVLCWIGVSITPIEAIVAIPFYYLLITITPNMPIADVGIRGSWALVVFCRYGEAPLITVAIVVLYVINTLLPTLIGSIITLSTNSTTPKKNILQQ